MKKLLCMILAVLLLAGCGNQKNQGDNKEQPIPIGTWQIDLDICDLINERVANLESMDVFFIADSFVLDLEFTFRKDGTYEVKVDEKSVKTAVENLETLAEEYLLMGLEEQLMGLQNEQYDDPEETYVEITMEQMLEQNGTTLEELKKQMKELLGTETMKDEILAQANREGTFKAEEGVLYLSQDMQSQINEEAYILYTVEKKVLTFEEGYGNADDMATVYLYPMEWQKVK